MTRTPASFKQIDVERMIRAAQKLGLVVSGLSVENGKPIVYTADQLDKLPARKPAKELERF